MTDDANDTFDYSPLGQAWWIETGRELGASDKQTKFAAKAPGLLQHESGEGGGLHRHYGRRLADDWLSVIPEQHRPAAVSHDGGRGRWPGRHC